ncbi:uncharacterized protein LOC121906389 isoform X3 [Thunnus maccoyii]|uniref:uncharacterized protein LOC121906389 isoform X3 n=1 Tax=Thunnus maccoyii TaxID=8240 RepID=UPI001C4D6076|nr:uncharacterized protein LOC121906389 isoform X3 [Thunnus maccoyii]XP_042281176.1 uncharacterized protein LOC121906389 isoform X3 [Thunnus maccoyii]
MFILYSKSKFSRKYHSVRSSLLKCEIWDLFQQGWIYDFSDPDSFAPGRQLHLQKMPEGKHAEPQSDVEGSNTDDAPSDDCIKAQDNSIGRKKYMLYLEPQSTSGLLRGLKRSTLQRQQQLVVQVQYSHYVFSSKLNKVSAGNIWKFSLSWTQLLTSQLPQLSQLPRMMTRLPRMTTWLSQTEPKI